jgi:hypothetical protein
MKKGKVRLKLITIQLPDAGSNLHYAKKHSLGMTVRILDNGIAQMLRILPRSMAVV